MDIVAGIDISKESLDVFIKGKSKKISNDRVGHKRILQWCQTTNVRLVVMEATSSYHEALARFLTEHEVPVTVVNPARPHFYAKALGSRNKTDKVDAQLLSEYGQAIADLPLYRPPRPEQEQFTELVRTRHDLVALATKAKIHLSEASSLALRTQLLESQESFYAAQIEQVDAHLRALLKEHPSMAEMDELLRSIPGIGNITSWTLIAEIQDFTRFAGPKPIAAYAGVCPSVRQSGTSLKSPGSMCRNGNRQVRKILYMAAVAAIRCEGEFKNLYGRLCAKGKAPKQALVAVMHKLIRIARAVVVSRCPFNPERTLTSI